MLDVRDFEDGNITVKALGEGEIIVEGKTEKKSTGSSVSKSFRRRFVLPGLVKNEAISSARSSDGVLTITAPKKVDKMKAYTIVFLVKTCYTLLIFTTLNWWKFLTGKPFYDQGCYK